MAYTVTRIQGGTSGNDRIVHLDITADAATQTVETGLALVRNFVVGAQSCSTGPQYVYANSNASGIQSNGVLGMSGFTNGDELYITVYGR